MSRFPLLMTETAGLRIPSQKNKAARIVASFWGRDFFALFLSAVELEQGQASLLGFHKKG